MRAGIVAAISMGWAAVWTGCAAAQPAPIKVGLVGPLTGPAATSGNNWRRALELAVNEVNAAGGLELDGVKRTFTVIAEDSQSRPEVGLSAAQKLLTRDNVDLFVGDLIHSSVTLAIMELSPSFPNKLFFSASGVSPDIGKKVAASPKKYLNFYKFNFKTDDYAATAYGTIKALTDSGMVRIANKTIGLIVEDTDFGKSVIDYIKDAFGPEGWTIAATEIVPIDQADFYPQLTKLKAIAPGLLITASTSIPGGIALVRQIGEQKLPAFHFAINYPSQEEFRKGAGASKEGLLYTPMMFDAERNPAHKELAAKLLKAGIPASGESASGYCNGAILLDAVKRAASLKIAQLEEAMAKTDFRCAVGRWVFDPDTHSPKIGPDYFSIPAAQFTDGIDQIVWPPALATTQYRTP